MANRLLILALFLSITCPAAWAQDPDGPEFQVNSYTTGNQKGASVASDPSGNFVVAWNSRGQDGSGDGVFGQRFSAAGLPQASEFRVNAYTAGHQLTSAVASDASGNFVVVWDSDGQDGSGYGVFAQRFSAAGLPQASEFRVNARTAGHQFKPAVASDASGNFVVVWNGAGQDGSGVGVFGQRFHASGLPQGPEFRVNTYTMYDQRASDVGSDANGNFVVVWHGVGQDGNGGGIFGQRFNAAGLRLGSEFRANTYTTNHQLNPSTASDTNGNFVIVWQSFAQDGDGGDGVFGQRFNAAGLPLGSEFRVNTYSSGQQVYPSAASDANGNFVVVWQSYYSQDGSSYGVFGQRFSAGGVPRGPEFQVNSYTTQRQYRPAVASAANGNFVAVWQSQDQGGSSYGIFGQRYGDLIFKNGFE